MAKQVRKLQIEIERGLKQTEEVSLFNSYSLLGRRSSPAVRAKDRKCHFFGNEGEGRARHEERNQEVAATA
jgi:hypothetical protein